MGNIKLEVEKMRFFRMFILVNGKRLKIFLY